MGKGIGTKSIFRVCVSCLKENQLVVMTRKQLMDRHLQKHAKINVLEEEVAALSLENEAGNSSRSVLPGPGPDTPSDPRKHCMYIFYNIIFLY